METQFRKTFKINLLYLVPPPPPRPPQRSSFASLRDRESFPSKSDLEGILQSDLDRFFRSYLRHALRTWLSFMAWPRTVYFRVTLTVFSRMKLTLSRDGILGHEFDKRLESFAQCYSQSLLLADFYRKPILYSGFRTKKNNSSLFTNSILYNRKTREENQTIAWVWEDSSLCPETSTKTAVQDSITERAL